MLRTTYRIGSLLALAFAVFSMGTLASAPVQAGALEGKATEFFVQLMTAASGSAQAHNPQLSVLALIALVLVGAMAMPFLVIAFRIVLKIVCVGFRVLGWYVIDKILDDLIFVFVRG